MASNFGFKTFAILALALLLCVQCTLGEISCENLDKDTCAYAISSTGKRCVLEKQVRRSGDEAYTCRTSEIEADKLRNWVETDQCLQACGLDRKVLGISSDSLLESRFTQKLCSPQCYDSCPNIVNLYFNLAAGEGVFLPKLCETQQKKNVRRGMAEIRSSGNIGGGTITGTIGGGTITGNIGGGPIHREKLVVAHRGKLVVAQGPIQSDKFTVATAEAEAPSY